MITFSHVYKTYPGPTHALRDVSFRLDRGEFAFVTGHSGAGKSTLFRLIAGFDLPTSGGVEVGSYQLGTLETKKLGLIRQQIGIVFQDFRLINEYTVAENVALPLRIRRENKFSIERKVAKALDSVGLKQRAKFYPEQLSGGEKQRVSIARALIFQPNILIADEPTGNLDSDLAKEILVLFQNAHAQGTTVLFATHDRDLFEKTSHRVIRLKEGQVVETMDPVFRDASLKQLEFS
ncbi:MAG: cell division ATP-binding protein FtsE [Bdellovibrionales bacterium CG10_big_fil_rev_8_21_14_0_10_45_34]|nr:MAG: cell division ATP-binding protein FtsE [Bdellovibrionales bacterium CG10_big_fil_rev_8_21_14_0_10_45_34]